MNRATADNVFAMVRCLLIARMIRVAASRRARIIAKFEPIAGAALALALVALLGAATAAAALAAGKRPVWSDEFNGPVGTPDPAKWSFDTGGNGWGNGELQYYTPPDAGNATLDGRGHLAITARAEKYTGPDGASARYTSARLETLHTFEFTYGLVEARIRVPRGDGLLPTFWALGSDAYDGPNSWPASGEIDAMEVRGAAPQVVHGTLHGPWPWLPGGLGSQFRASAPLSRKFHTYAVKWSPSRIAFMLDGTAYRTVSPSDLRRAAPWPFQHPFFLLLHLAVGGKFAGPVAPATRFPATMLVDWVRVWQ
jgi:beta-glucanase (GH16 family)